MTTSTPILEVRGIVKRYPGVTALGGVSLSIHSGEVVAVIGENGAGKSTLMKVLGGIVRPDEGEILHDGKPVQIDSVNRSVELGIGFIHQELNPLDNLDVAGNVFLGREPSKWGLIDYRKMHADTARLLEQLALPISVDTPLTRLSLAQRQMVEIAKALSLNARVLIMDEPTSSLTLSETARLLQVVRDLREKGVGVVYISHRLGEVTEVADRVVALKDGQNAGALARDEIDHDRMVRLMVGRDLERMTLPSYGTSGDVRLSVQGLRTNRYPSKEVSFEVRAGEIFCLAGLVGAGRSEVVQTIFGADPALNGVISIDGAPVRSGNLREAIAAGIGLVPEDRREVGLLVDWNIRENMTLPNLRDFSSKGLVQRGAEEVAAAAQSKALAVKSPSTQVRCANLSGGNQQKVVLGKWLLSKPKLLILDEPTRGVDVGAKAEIYEIMRRLTNEGVAVLMVSSDMEEVLGVSDRIGVMHEGSLSGTLTRAEATEEKIMRLAVGRNDE
ncbi:sugar ABC transporter ATP-binding protein [Fimbriimonas ginsengisoli]|uniref:Sugar ABC transporter ATP-binding protein n=1 Tax=Fimbriimonas ginsengisoli Gsoil 348 TaxID=661478 RepID=A0A068NMI2_FIMGI|nr:sugar ABC transporter ATP-binding protein [Fimbriimonas ginsengisoli]AIE84666.1 sugar ABC transporter ATP-binding protein [Fimbriimonas ginsengisoli Gsoil 348]